MTTPLSAIQALAIVNHCPFPLLLLDPQGHVIGYNGAFEQLIGGAQAAELQGDEFATLSDHPLRTLLSNASSVYGVTAWRRNDKSTSLLKRAAMALSQARAEHRKQSIAL